MYSTSYTIADLKNPPSASSIQRNNTQRSLHGSQSHANFHFGSSLSTGAGGGGPTNLNASSLNDAGTAVGGVGGQQPQQYMPGYLLSATQGQAAPSHSQNFSLQPLETERTIKRATSAFGRGFGEDSLLTSARPSPKGRSPRVGNTDDENAPPTLSISESQYLLSESGTQRHLPRHSSGGFHPLSQSRAPYTPSSSMSTTYESQTPPRNPHAMDEDLLPPPAGRGYSVTIFGFWPDQRQQAIKAFLTNQARLIEDESLSEEAKKRTNFVEIEYASQWEAVRAVRKNGFVSLDGGNIRLGAVWTDPSQAPLENGNGLGIDTSNHANSHLRQVSVPSMPSPTSAGMGNSRSVRVRPSASAFRNATIATTTPSSARDGGQTDEWGVAAEARRLESQTGSQATQPEGMLNRVSSMVFGRWGT